MGVKVNIPPPQQNTSVGRRLFSMAAPIAGFALGGPAGAAAASVLGSRVGGASVGDSLANGLQTGIDYMGKSKTPKAAGLDMDALPKLEKPELGESAFGRRLETKMQEPGFALQSGLDHLSTLPADNPLRQQYTEPLVRAQFALQRPKLIR